jgi:hypothetical protein
MEAVRDVLGLPPIYPIERKLQSSKILVDEALRKIDGQEYWLWVHKLVMKLLLCMSVW